MKRRHLRGDAIAMCDRIRTLRPDAVFGADLIAGFPTETEEMFANSLAIIEECDLTHLHVFPYSIREGTPAANMPHIEVKERRARAKRLREAGSLRMQNLLESRVGKFAEILVEKDNTGRCERYLPVKLDSEAAPGALVRARITGRDGDKLTAQKLTAITI
jgi:threonylcarbamoyladenosine tRNA methylthiotransferase MtaB